MFRSRFVEDDAKRDDEWLKASCYRNSKVLQLFIRLEIRIERESISVNQTSPISLPSVNFCDETSN